MTSPTIEPGHSNATVIGTDGNPSPSGGDRVLLDTRSSLQQVTNLQQAWALFPGNDHSPARTAAGGLGWSLARNFDNAGTSALRADWPTAKRCSDETNRIIDYLPDPLPTTLYVQWTTRFGRHPYDASGNGAANFYTIENSACQNASAYAMSLFRDDGDDDGGEEEANFKMWYAGRPLATALFEQQGMGDELITGNQGWIFAPSKAAGRAVKFTVLYQGASRKGARDGVLRVWIDGKLYFERTNINSGARGIDRFEFPGWRFGTVAESEYIWDVLAWTPPPPPPARIVVTPAKSSIEVGATVPLDVTSYDAGGRKILNGVITWTTSDNTIATVGSDGTVTGTGAGVAKITATSGPASATATVTVTLPTPVRLLVTPASTSITIGAKFQLVATAYDTRDAVVNAGPIKWTTSEAKFATVDANGLVSGVAAGKATITATLGKLKSSSEVKVTATPPKVTLVVSLTSTSLVEGQSAQASFVVNLPFGSYASAMVRPTWSSSNPTVATVSSTGAVTAVAPGTTYIVATADGLSGQALLTVMPPAGSSPMPGPGATVLLDMRQSLQQAKTIYQALALFGVQDHTQIRDSIAPTPNGSGWSFTTNADGHGLHALRADWSVSPADQGIRVIQYFATPTNEVYARWTGRLGKYAADADANGATDSYAMFPQTLACKRALFDRPDNLNRVDYTWNRATPEGPKVEMGDHNYVQYGDATLWNPNSSVGGAPFTTVVHVRAASSDLVNDGIFQLWVNGILMIDQHDVPATAEPFDRWSFPEICVLVPQPQSEYFWDILVWRP